MSFNIVLCVLSAKYTHASLAPWCLVAGIEEYTATDPALKDAINTHVTEFTVKDVKQDVLKAANKLADKKPSILGFSCYIWNIGETLLLAEAVKALCPDVCIVFGGPEVSYNAEDVLGQNPFIDYIISGEAELTFAQLAAKLYSKKDIHSGDINALYSHKFTAASPNINKNPGKEPPNACTQNYVAAAKGRIAYIESSRGCPYSCAFCLSGRCDTPKYFSLNTVFDNIIALSQSGCKTIKFVDRTFNANATHANAILNFICENYGKNDKIPDGTCFHFEIAADILKESSLEILKKLPVGAIQLEIGMQSFNEETLSYINRRTDTKLLQQNILKLLNFNNIHIHIDLIAGLPLEGIASFKNSFNTGYALGAHVMQLGFLKVLHGSAIKNNAEKYPCTYSQTAPYEVIETPWITKDELDLLRLCESELERMYNSARFRRTAKYALSASKMSPFDFYCHVGKAADACGVAPHGVSLDEYTAFLYKELCGLNGVDKNLLRDEMVKDRLATNSTGKLPKALIVPDKMLAKLTFLLTKDERTAPKNGVKRGVAILYGANKICYTDYLHKNTVTNEYILHELYIDNLIQ